MLLLDAPLLELDTLLVLVELDAPLLELDALLAELDTPLLELEAFAELLEPLEPLELLEPLLVARLLDTPPELELGTAIAEDEEKPMFGSEALEDERYSYPSEDEESSKTPPPGTLLLLALLQANNNKLAKKTHQHLYFINAS